jgi:hypothetical protein
VQFLPLLLALSFGTPSGTHRVRLDVDVLAPVRAPLPEIETLGAILQAGVVLPGELHLGLDGQPSMPFLGPFFYAQEIRITQVDPITLAGQLMITARAEL